MRTVFDEDITHNVIISDEEQTFSRIEGLTVDGLPRLESAISHFSSLLRNLKHETLFKTVDIEHLAKKLYYDRPVPPLNLFPPPSLPQLTCDNNLLGLSDGSVYDIAFKSELPSDAPDWYRSLARNSTVHARIWEHTDKARPTIVALHGWSMGEQRVNSLAFLPGQFFKRGFNVALFELPFHGRRTEVGFENNFPGTDLELTGLAMRQSISDLRALRLVLRARGHTDTCGLGVSLGSYIGALWASLDKLEGMILTVPLASLEQLAWDVVRRSFPSDQLAGLGVTKSALHDALAFHSPLSYSPKTTGDRVMIVAGRGDAIISKKQLKLLRGHFVDSQLVWVKHGHGARIGFAAKEIKAFLRRLGMLAEKI